MRASGFPCIECFILFSLWPSRPHKTKQSFYFSNPARGGVLYSKRLWEAMSHREWMPSSRSQRLTEQWLQPPCLAYHHAPWLRRLSTRLTLYGRPAGETLMKRESPTRLCDGPERLRLCRRCYKSPACVTEALRTYEQRECVCERWWYRMILRSHTHMSTQARWGHGRWECCWICFSSRHDDTVQQQLH